MVITCGQNGEHCAPISGTHPRAFESAYVPRDQYGVKVCASLKIVVVLLLVDLKPPGMPF